MKATLHYHVSVCYIVLISPSLQNHALICPNLGTMYISTLLWNSGQEVKGMRGAAARCGFSTGRQPKLRLVGLSWARRGKQVSAFLLGLNMAEENSMRSESTGFSWGLSSLVHTHSTEMITPRQSIALLLSVFADVYVKGTNTWTNACAHISLTTYVQFFLWICFTWKVPGSE